MVIPIVTAGSSKHKHLGHIHPYQSPATDAEISKLTKLFGKHSPRLSAQQFAESLQLATPVTQSLFRQFYAINGSWGKFLKKYRIPCKQYETEVYVPSVFGRLYINKDEERRILYTELDSKQDNGLTAQFVGSPAYSQLMRHPLLGIRQMLAATRLNVGAYYHYKRFDEGPEINRLPEDTTLDMLASVKDQLVNSTVPLLFQVTAFRDCCLKILYKRVHRHVSPELWEQLLRPARPSLITEILQNTPSHTGLIECLGHRGTQEYELAKPRWSENQSELFKLYDAGSFSSVSFDDVTALRQSVVERFASSWDKQIIETHFLLYDYYYGCRERIHDKWIQGLTQMRRILLSLDSSAQLDGLIWFATMEEITALYPKFDTLELGRRRSQHNEFNAINPPTELAGELWSSLVNGKADPASIGDYPVRRLVGGQATGMSGTVEDIEDGKPVSILVVKSLDPSLVIYFNQIKGIITETGGLLSHGAILARELGIPAVILEKATSIIASNVKVTINATEEQIEINRSQ